jgi:hypothetical protein
MGDKPLTVVYIAGSGRSGSTLLDLLLGSLPGACSLGEFARIWYKLSLPDQYCGCGRLFPECPFWSAVARDAIGGFETVDAARLHRFERRMALGKNLLGLRFPRFLAGPVREEIRRDAELRGALYRGAAGRSGARVLVDSSKHLYNLLIMRQVPGVDLKVVYLVRDSRGFANSWTRLKKEFVNGKAVHTVPVRTVRYSARHWAWQRVRDRILLAGTGGFLRVRYEDLCRDPAATIQRIMTFAGYPEMASPFDPTNIVPANHHTVHGNPMRTGTEPIAVRLDDGWLREMSKADQRAVTWRTLPWLLWYRYAGPFKK